MTTIKKVDRNCFRGPRPTDLRELRVKYDIDTIIDLESGIYDVVRVYDETYYTDVQQFPPDYGMDYYHMPCSDLTAPKPIFVDKAIELMANSERHVYVHCLSGVDRTGFVCAVYRMRVQGWTFNAARAEWIELGRHPWYFYWDYALKEFDWRKQ
jgi:protein-tyrosine phosphatase